MAIYLKIDGIDGNVTAKGHEKTIELHSMNFGTGRTMSSARPGHQTNREASILNFTDVSFSKDMDETTPKLFTECCKGASKKVEIFLVRTDQDQIQTYMQYTLSDAVVNKYSMGASGSGGQHPAENISINFSKVEMKYTPYGDDHKPGTPVPAGYNLVEGVTL